METKLIKDYSKDLKYLRYKDDEHLLADQIVQLLKSVWHRNFLFLSLTITLSVTRLVAPCAGGTGGPRSSTTSFEARHTAAGVGKRAKCWDYITQGEKDKTTTTENDIKAKVFCMPLSSDVLSYISFFFLISRVN